MTDLQMDTTKDAAPGLRPVVVQLSDGSDLTINGNAIERLSVLAADREANAKRAATYKAERDALLALVRDMANQGPSLLRHQARALLAQIEGASHDHNCLGNDGEQCPACGAGGAP